MTILQTAVQSAVQCPAQQIVFLPTSSTIADTRRSTIGARLRTHTCALARTCARSQAHMRTHAGALARTHSVADGARTRACVHAHVCARRLHMPWVLCSCCNSKKQFVASSSDCPVPTPSPTPPTHSPTRSPTTPFPTWWPSYAPERTSVPTGVPLFVPQRPRPSYSSTTGPHTSGGMSTGMIVGIAVGGCGLVAVMVGAVFFMVQRRNNRAAATETSLESSNGGAPPAYQ